MKNNCINNRALFNTERLSKKGKVIVEYVWIGGTGQDIRSKSKTYENPINSIEQVEDWYFDGSSTFQAKTISSEILLKPVALFDDPFLGLPNKIVLCETYNNDGKPTNSNFRNYAEKIFEKDQGREEPWFGMEQEYVLITPYGTNLEWPYGWPMGGYPKPQGQYYCSVGIQNNYGREVMISHYKACLYAGIKIYGTNAEVMPGQWEFQIGTCKGIEIADNLWMARYLLLRVAEFHSLGVNFDPKPISGDWSGSGCHTNFSTNSTRNDTMLKAINEHMKILAESHDRLIQLYGENNDKRLTGKHETSSLNSFSFGIANRGCSVRIPRKTEFSGKGYYEDRRPAANIDPYVVSAALFSITCLNREGLFELENHYKAFLKDKK